MFRGSSPRGRGKRRSAILALLEPGLIPAWAGKTALAGSVSGGIEAHPRVGGENECAAKVDVRQSGSSPRGRGKLTLTNSAVLPDRLIPAWAGKTRTRAMPAGHFRAHPRVGGENSKRLAPETSYAGSSPRGRGKQHAIRAGDIVCRLIPAWAGKTRLRSVPAAAVRAHPRVGGENVSPEFSRAPLRGSSPRGRGKRPLTTCALQACRLIPAWAGKTPSSRPRSTERRAHPRVGGENNHSDLPHSLPVGSSPRGRGKRMS